MILLAAGTLLASGCVYRMSIQQGNYPVAESVAQLKEGMTRSQVRFLLGTPMVPVYSLFVVGLQLVRELVVIGGVGRLVT